MNLIDALANYCCGKRAVNHPRRHLDINGRLVPELDPDSKLPTVNTANLTAFSTSEAAQKVNLQQCRT